MLNRNAMPRGPQYQTDVANMNKPGLPSAAPQAALGDQTGMPNGPEGLAPTFPQQAAQKIDISCLLDALAGSRPADLALTVDDESWTFAELRTHALRAASLLAARGVQPDHIVALPMTNSLEQTAFFFGAWRLGATPLPLAPKTPDLELEKILSVAGAKIVLREGQDLKSQPLWSGPCRVASRVRAQPTGGSTGLPKIIMDMAPSTIDPTTDGWGRTTGNTMFVPGPTFHSGPMNHLLEGLARGVHVVLMRRFDARKAVELITRHRPHWALFVPTMMSRIMKLPRDVLDSADFSSLKVVWHSAASCPPSVKQQWIDLVGPDAVWEIFGGSEGVAVTIISGTEWLAHRGSVGRVAAGEITILDEEGQPVPNGQVGEIYMRSRTGAGRMQVKAHATTKPRIRGDWESFGDLGWFDDDGYLYLADRRMDMINSGGQNIYPAEVEAAILSYPGISDAVVFGQKDDDLGEMVCALIYCEGAQVNVDDLLAHLATQIVRYKIPRRISFSNEQIRNDAGKVRRSELKIAEQA
jgi:bile acid-coenzyme A ligase